MAERSFESIHDDYAFFRAHSQGWHQCRKAVLAELQDLTPGGHPLRLLDFGCGNGRFLASVLKEWGVDPSRLAVAAVDIDKTWLSDAAAAIRPLAAEVRTATTVEEFDGEFDVILSNHVFYYVGDPTLALRGLWNRLKPGGRLVLTIGARGNHVSNFWIAAYGEDHMPWNLADDIVSAWKSVIGDCRETEIPADLAFEDTRENRLKILRFLFAETLERFDVDALLAEFDHYRVSGRIVINYRDLVLVAQKP